MISLPKDVIVGHIMPYLMITDAIKFAIATRSNIRNSIYMSINSIELLKWYSTFKNVDVFNIIYVSSFTFKEFEDVFLALNNDIFVTGKIISNVKQQSDMKIEATFQVFQMLQACFIYNQSLMPSLIEYFDMTFYENNKIAVNNRLFDNIEMTGWEKININLYKVYENIQCLTLSLRSYRFCENIKNNIIIRDEFLYQTESINFLIVCSRSVHDQNIVAYLLLEVFRYLNILYDKFKDEHHMFPDTLYSPAFMLGCSVMMMNIRMNSHGTKKLIRERMLEEFDRFEDIVINITFP